MVDNRKGFQRRQMNRIAIFIIEKNQVQPGGCPQLSAIITQRQGVQFLLIAES